MGEERDAGEVTPERQSRAYLCWNETAVEPLPLFWNATLVRFRMCLGQNANSLTFGGRSGCAFL
jgi:hypothetical protein